MACKSDNISVPTREELDALRYELQRLREQLEYERWSKMNHPPEWPYPASPWDTNYPPRTPWKYEVTCIYK